MKYIVMECHLSYAVVLDEYGRFLKVANLHYRTGQTVTHVIAMQEPDQEMEAAGSPESGPPEALPRKTQTPSEVQRTPEAAVSETARKTSSQPARKSRWLYSLGALAACLVLVVGVVFKTQDTIYGSVYMEINPSIRIDVNRSDSVIALESLNEDGAALIRDYQYRKKSLDLVVDQLMDRAIEMGFLSEGGRISLSLDGKSSDWVVQKEESLDTHLSDYMSGKFAVTIEVGEGQPSSHENPAPPGTPPSHDSSDSDYDDDDYGDDPDPSPQKPGGNGTPPPPPEQDPPDDDGTDYQKPDNPSQSSYRKPDEPSLPDDDDE